MQFDDERQERVLNRYRFMFRVSLGVIGGASLLLVLSLAGWYAGSMPGTLPLSILLIDLGALTAYRVLLSTARMLPVEEAAAPVHDRVQRTP